jgi:hypothetical protein
MKALSYVLTLAVVVFLSSWASEARAEGQSIGGGVHYWIALDDIDVDDIDEDGVAWVISYQRQVSDLLTLELDVEILPDDFAGADGTVLAPQAYLLLGAAIYGGVGIGIYHADDEFADDPFFVARAGIKLEILPDVMLDVSGNYRFTEWDDSVTADIDTDTVTIAATARLAL